MRNCLILLLIFLQIFYLAFPSDLLCQASTARVLKVTGSRITVYTEKKIDWEIGSKCLFKYRRPGSDFKLTEVVDSAAVVSVTANTADLDLFNKMADLKGISLLELPINYRAGEKPGIINRLVHKWQFWAVVGVVVVLIIIFWPDDDNKENPQPGRISIHIPAN